jgi:hypothetical protein
MAFCRSWNEAFISMMEMDDPGFKPETIALAWLFVG